MSISVDPLFVIRSRACGKRSITDITQDHAIGSAQPVPRWRRPPQDNKLMAEKCVSFRLVMLIALATLPRPAAAAGAPPPPS
jgi:hypothetical protein